MLLTRNNKEADRLHGVAEPFRHECLHFDRLLPCRQRHSTGASSAGAALGSVLPSAGSMQQMVGLTLMAGMPSVPSSVPRRNRGKCRSLTVSTSANCAKAVCKIIAFDGTSKGKLSLN